MDWRENFDGSLLDSEALAYLLRHELDAGSAAAQVTKRVMTDGLSGLSEKQLQVFKEQVADAWLLRKCKCGNHDVEGHELIGLWGNEGYCGRCAEREQEDR